MSPGTTGPDTRAALAAVLVGLTLASALLIAHHLELPGAAEDDAYIHLRIARNLVDHGVPYFNLGEPVKGSSSTGWVLFVSLLMTLFPVYKGWMLTPVAIANALLTTCCAALWTLACLRAVPDLRHRRLVGAAIFVACVGILLRASVGLMETPLALTLTALGVLLLQRRRASAFAPLAVVPFVRPELGLLTVTLAVAYLLARDEPERERPSLGPALLYGLAGAMPLLAFDLAHYGTIMPQPIWAKLAVYDLSLGDAAALLAHHAACPLATGALAAPCKLGHGLMIVALAGAAWVAGRHGTPTSRAVLAGGTLLMGAYVLGRSYVQAWYAPLVLVPLLFGALVPLLRAGRRVSAALLALAAAPYWCVVGLATVAATAAPELDPAFRDNGHVRRLAALGRRLRGHYPGATLATSEVGAVGYTYRGRVLDAVGLVSPEALAHHPLAVPGQRAHGSLGAIPPSLIEVFKPELIASRPVLVEALSRSRVLERAYEQLEAPIEGLLLWRRRDVAGHRRPGLRRSPPRSE